MTKVIPQPLLHGMVLQQQHPVAEQGAERWESALRSVSTMPSEDMTRAFAQSGGSHPGVASVGATRKSTEHVLVEMTGIATGHISHIGQLAARSPTELASSLLPAIADHARGLPHQGAHDMPSRYGQVGLSRTAYTPVIPSIPQQSTRLPEGVSRTEPATSPALSSAIPDWVARRLQLVVRDGMIDVRVRDYHLDRDQVGELVNALQKWCKLHGMEVRKITINGHAKWQADSLSGNNGTDQEKRHG